MSSEAHMQQGQIRRRQVPVWIVLILATLAAGTAAIWIRMSNVGPLPIAAWRLLLSLAVLWPLARRRGEQPGHMATGDAARCTVAGLLLAVHFAAWIPAVQTTTVAHATVLVCLHPILVLAGERWLFGRKVATRQVASIALA